jgi:PhzF family phenazine biosynthesis protein
VSPTVLRYAAFTTDPAGGNPAGVVVDAAGLDDARMREIAAEVGYSETAFVTGGDERRRRFELRYFSPLAEVAFCGHATVATAVELGRRLGPGRLVFATRAGEVPVEVTSDDTAPRATLTSVETSSVSAGDTVVDAALAALRWERADLDPRFPPHVAFGGNHHLVLGVRTRSRLAELHYDVDALADLMREQDWTTVHLFCTGADGTYHARNPFPVGGVVEDAATGAAAAAFGGYLRALGLVPEPTSFLVRQGEDMGRPSELHVTVTPDDARVRVSGQAVVIPA